jgi:hypothetical protein
MILMFRRSFLSFGVAVAGFMLAVAPLTLPAQQSSDRGRKYKAPPQSSRIEVTVVRDASGKPVESAAVIFHPIQGDRDMGGMELKTDADGKAVIDVIPIGDTVRMQVLAKGFQTYGEDFKIDKDSMTREVRLKRPGEQYSIYKQHSGDKPAADGSQTPPAGDSKPADSNSQPAPNQSQPKAN